MVIIEEIKYTGAYPLAATIPKSAGPKPIVASQNIKKVETAYDLRFWETFLVTMAVHAELRVPKPKAAHTAQTITANADG